MLTSDHRRPGRHPKTLHTRARRNPLDGAKRRIGRQIMQSPLRSSFEQGTSKARRRARGRCDSTSLVVMGSRGGLEDPHCKPARSWRRNNVIVVVKDPTLEGLSGCPAAWLLGCLSRRAGETGKRFVEQLGRASRILAAMGPVRGGLEMGAAVDVLAGVPASGPALGDSACEELPCFSPSHEVIDWVARNGGNVDVHARTG
ncbi:hypothetical protein HDV57DRAFT_241438 [Trichoderma longibrachiatum]